VIEAVQVQAHSEDAHGFVEKQKNCFALTILVNVTMEKNHHSPRLRPKVVATFDLLLLLCGSCLLSLAAFSSNLPVYSDFRHPNNLFSDAVTDFHQSVGSNDQPLKNQERNISALPRWLREYFSWHNNSLKVLKSNHSMWNQYKYLVVRCLKMDHKCGGASDRLQSIPLALLLASQHERLLFIEWEKPAQLTEFLEPVALDWRMPKWLIGTSRKKSFLTFQRSPTILSDKHFYRLSTHSEEILLDMRYQSTDHGEAYFNRHEKNDQLTFEQVYSSLWSLMFRPSEPVQHVIDATRAELGLAENYVSLHVRSLYLKDKSENTAQIENAVNCAASLRAHDQSSFPTIFIASDSPAVLDFSTQYGTSTLQRKIVAAKSRIETPPLHLDRGSKFMSPVDSETDWMGYPPSAYYNIFVDLYLLSYGQCISYNVGGYGRWASLISRNRNCSSINHRHTVCNPNLS
jgi:hypothetical protein